MLLATYTEPTVRALEQVRVPDTLNWSVVVLTRTGLVHLHDRDPGQALAGRLRGRRLLLDILNEIFNTTIVALVTRSDLDHEVAPRY